MAGVPRSAGRVVAASGGAIRAAGLARHARAGGEGSAPANRGAKLHGATLAAIGPGLCRAAA